MKVFKLPQLAQLSGLANEGEYVLTPSGAAKTALRYGRMLRSETGRRVSPSGADTEIVFIVKGNISVRCGKSAFPVSAGEAFFLEARSPLEFDNTGEADAVYVVACGPREGAQAPAAAQGQTPCKEPPHPGPEEPVAEAQDEFEITKDAGGDEEPD